MRNIDQHQNWIRTETAPDLAIAQLIITMLEEQRIGATLFPAEISMGRGSVGTNELYDVYVAPANEKRARELVSGYINDGAFFEETTDETNT